jgi:hypothetical protein
MSGPALLSRNQVDQLGGRLQADDYSDEDLRALDRFRRSYAAAYERTVKAIRDELQLAPTGRPPNQPAPFAKSYSEVDSTQSNAGYRRLSVLVVDRSRQRSSPQDSRSSLHQRVIGDRPKHGYGPFT